MSLARTNTFTHYARLVRTMASVHYAMMVAYRAEIVMWAFASALPLIMLGVWAEAGASGLFAMDRVDMVRYFIAIFVVRQLTVVWVIHDFEWQVVSGRLSPLLLQPADPSWRFFFAHIGEQMARMPIVLGLLVLCFVLYPEGFLGSADKPGLWSVSPWKLAGAVAAMYLAFVLRFWQQYALAVGAFWFERISAAHGLIFLPYMFFSGMVVPLAVVREQMPMLYSVLLWTPFPYMMWFPAALLTGEEAPIGFGFVMLVGWCAAFFVLQRVCWRLGVKHYSAMGA